MNGRAASWLTGGRLHLQHGPIDLIIKADGTRQAVAASYRAAIEGFELVLGDLVQELPALRRPIGNKPPALQGRVARRMGNAVAPFALDHFITPMAAVAGSVADHVLAAMTSAAGLRRAYVNNGGDIALFLAPGETYRTAIAGYDGAELGRIALTSEDAVCGIATSGRHGRSHSLGAADSVTVLAETAALADATATLIANAVDLPGHPAIARLPATQLDPDSDLGERLVVTDCKPLTREDCEYALRFGLRIAEQFIAQGHIAGAVLTLQGRTYVTPAAGPHISVVGQIAA